MGDAMWCLGINRFIFHTYAHQPWLDKAPGMTMGQWGTHFGRTNTWWEQSRPWMQYIARSQYLLQQGRTVADVLFFAGEAAPNGGIMLPELKAKGYEYDVVGTDLIMALSVKDGLIRTPVGGSYRMLVLPDTDWMTPALAKKVGELVEAGAMVVGPEAEEIAEPCPTIRRAMPKWRRSPTKFGDRRRANMRSAAERSSRAARSRRFWPPRRCSPISRSSAAKPSSTSSIAPSTAWTSTSSPIRRRSPETVDCSFRVAGRQPELWDAETGDDPARADVASRGRPHDRHSEFGASRLGFRRLPSSRPTRRPIRSSRSRVRPMPQCRQDARSWRFARRFTAI